jgi:hypothetical protein
MILYELFPLPGIPFLPQYILQYLSAPSFEVVECGLELYCSVRSWHDSQAVQPWTNDLSSLSCLFSLIFQTLQTYLMGGGGER